MQSIALSKLNSSSQLYKNYLQNAEIFKTFFPTNEKLYDKEYLRQTAESFANRNASIKTISKTMEELELSKIQIDNLELFKQNNSLSVVTGQQIGFLGGPLYTFYKIQSTIQKAKELKLNNPEFEFVPVFWLEDNDHDAQEASEAFYYNQNNDIAEISSHNKDEVYRDYVSNLTLPENIEQTIDELFSKLPFADYLEETKQLYTKIYKSGKKSNLAFLQLLQEFFAEDGLLFLSASIAREFGYTRYVALLEVSNQWKSVELIGRANNKLKEAGLQIQAKHSDVNLFYNENGEKYKIEVSPSNDYLVQGKIISQIDMTNEIINHPEKFSPNVLLRPLFQDSILPNIAYIAGAAEIAYSCQIYSLYETFAIRQPAILNRHHAFIIDAKTQKLLTENKLNPEYFISDFETIEKSIIINLKNENAELAISEAKVKIEDAVVHLKAIIGELDVNLSNSAEVMLHNINKEFERLEKKLNSSVKNKNAQYIKKYKNAHNWLYPDGNLQERVLTPLNILTQFGKNKFKIMLEEICSQDSKFIYFAGDNK